jgi:hypothetical protein
MLLKYRLHRFTPSPSDTIREWWGQLNAAVPIRQKKEINALIILVACCLLWLERNSSFSNGFATMPVEVCRKIGVEFDLWKKRQAVWKARRYRACSEALLSAPLREACEARSLPLHRNRL